ncbi:hypothetical protein SUGI_0565980 [Cryptomeria japonica]|nr:hypothetical protein SUGI_0565980 [Cryptomeria japonica]
MNSIATLPLDQSLNSSEICDGQMDYRGRENVLEVNASCRCKRKGPWKLSHRIDLTHYLPKDIVVGFAAAAYKSSEIHCLISWNFTRTISRSFNGGGKSEFPWKLAIAISFSCLVIANLIYFIIYFRKRTRPTSENM